MRIFDADISCQVFDYLIENLSGDLSLQEVNTNIQKTCGIVRFFDADSDLLQCKNELQKIEINSVAESDKIAYGDFQTNEVLTNQIVKKLLNNGCLPAYIIEPTCGKGNFILASLTHFKHIKSIVGIEINKSYIWQTKFNILDFFLSNTDTEKPNITIIHSSIFDFDFCKIKEQIGNDNLLIIGNPPWVTNSKLGELNSDNLPVKSNFKKQSGIDAITGKGNFDIAEYITLMLLKRFGDCNGNMAFLIKNTVIKNLVSDQKTAYLPISNIEKQSIDSKMEFGVSVDAALLLCQLNSKPELVCVESDFYTSEVKHQFGWVQNKFLSNINNDNEISSIDGRSYFEWRQGVKHDCTNVMELEQIDGHFKNKFGEEFQIEEELVYNILKSSDLKREIADNARKCTIITQKTIGQNTAYIKQQYPLTYNYLQNHIDCFHNRKSSIYRGKPDFSIFGIGDYSFKPYKVAISGLYKTFHFTLVLPHNNKPVMLDDTCYFIGFDKLELAVYAWILLNHKVTTRFLQSISFPDAKRMITKEVLMRIDLQHISKIIPFSDIENQLVQFGKLLNINTDCQSFESLFAKKNPQHQLSMF